MIIGAVEKKEKTTMLADSMRFRCLCALQCRAICGKSGILAAQALRGDEPFGSHPVFKQKSH